jgi:UPF0755 protein
MVRLLLYSLVLLALVAAGGSYGYRWLQDRFDEPGPLAAPAIVDLPSGTGLAAIAERLTEVGAIDDPTVFQIAVRLLDQGRTLKAGEYEIPAHASGRSIMAMLVEGRTIVHRVTVPEGLTSAEIVAIVAASPVLQGATPPPPPEGTLLPETYHVARGDERAAVIARMAADFEAALAQLWPARAPDLPLANPAEAVVLASIVEKETGLAGVFYNRLRLGMPLQSDPTVVYALTGGKEPLGRGLTRDDLGFESPFNTYQVTGLPPGPIANPGVASLEAVLHPEATDALYFVADGTGGHAFAATLAEHNRNVAKWRKVQDQQTAE